MIIKLKKKDTYIISISDFQMLIYYHLSRTNKLFKIIIIIIIIFEIIELRLKDITLFMYKINT